MLSLLFLQNSSTKSCKKLKLKKHKRTPPKGCVQSSTAGKFHTKSSSLPTSSSIKSAQISNPTHKMTAPGGARRSAPAMALTADRSPPILEPKARRSHPSTGSNASSSFLTTIFGLGLTKRRSGEDGRQRGGAGGEDVDQLLAGIQELHSTSKMASKMAGAQRKGADALGKWAQRTNNNAVGDVMGWTGELMRLHAERQAIFANDYEHFLKDLRKVAKTEQRMRAQEREVEKLAERERRLAKEFVQKEGHKMRVRLDRAAVDREEAERALSEARAEAEVVKMMHLRDALIGISDAQRNLAKAANKIFGCQRELVEFVPAVSTNDVRQMRYEGVPLTRQRVDLLRRSLDSGQVEMPYNAPSSVERRRQQLQRHSDPPPPFSSGAQHNQRIRRPMPSAMPAQLLAQMGTPPPPYSPPNATAPPFDDSFAGTPRGRLNPNRNSICAPVYLSCQPFFTAPTTAAPSAAAPRPAPVSPPASNTNRIYPLLPEGNPFAQSIQQRRAQRQGTNGHGLLTVGGRGERRGGFD